MKAKNYFVLPLLFFSFILFSGKNIFQNVQQSQRIEQSEKLSAVYAKLNSGEEFEKYSRTGPFADIVVKVGKAGKFVFQRASSYLPYWENASGKWYVKEMIKRNGDGTKKRPDNINRYSHVKIVENTPARVIIHWRYMPDFNHVKPVDWVDEFYTIYPDGNCYRTYRHGTVKLEDWVNPANLTIEHLILSKDGIRPAKDSKHRIPELNLSKASLNQFNKEKFNNKENSYVIKCRQNGLPSSLTFTLDAGSDYLISDPSVVIKNWGKNNVAVKVDNKSFHNFFKGYVLTAHGADLVVWLGIRSQKKLLVNITPLGKITPPENKAPEVNAGINRTVMVNGGTDREYRIKLDGNVKDDGLPGDKLAIKWEKVKGPGTVEFSKEHSPTSEAVFSAEGAYRLRLTANDGSLSSYDDVIIFIRKNDVSKSSPAAWWNFDEGKGDSTEEKIHKIKCPIKGPKSFWKAGIIGTALEFDGYKSAVVLPGKDAPVVTDGISVEAWIAIGAYPWNWAPVVQQADWGNRGYYLGINADGRVAFMISINGNWKRAIGLIRQTPYSWIHITGTYDEHAKKVCLYINGQPAASVNASGKIDMSKNDLIIGLNSKKFPGVDTERRPFPAIYGFDGLIDEVKIYNRALSDSEIEQNYNTNNPPDLVQNNPDMQKRILPSDPEAIRQFGAYYTKLNYYETWDDLWRLSNDPDIVVKFDQMPTSIVFWHGTTYSPGFVTENNKWRADQSLEEGGGGAKSLAEHMSDKQFRYSHVRIIENTDARIVIHWRYVNCDVLYDIPRVNKKTGWGDCVDEYYYIYPDGVAIRNVKYWSSIYGHYSWQDSQFLNPPGTRPEQDVDYSAGLLLADQKGKTAKVSWIKGNPPNPLPDANIEIMNLYSKYKPFSIFENGVHIHIHGGFTGYALSPTWNHWPVAQMPSDGRKARDPYRVSHTTLSETDIDDFKRGDCAIYGFTDEPVDSLVALAKSWNNNAELQIQSPNFVNDGYSRAQRAYILQRIGDENPEAIDLKLIGSKETPIVNPAFVIKGWGNKNIQLSINGVPVKRGEAFRYGNVARLNRTDLIVWIKYSAYKKADIIINRKHS